MNTASQSTTNIPHVGLNQKDTLLIAIGNSARSDDGLGWAFLEALQKAQCFRGSCMSCYQLQVEMAELVAEYPRVIFIDAAEGYLPEGFAWEKTEAENDFTFTTHALTPAAVLYLSQELYQQSPEAYTLKIKGEDWELKIGLSEQAQENLKNAIHFFQEKIKQ